MCNWEGCAYLLRVKQETNSRCSIIFLVFFFFAVCVRVQSGLVVSLIQFFIYFLRVCCTVIRWIFSSFSFFLICLSWYSFPSLLPSLVTCYAPVFLFVHRRKKRKREKKKESTGGQVEEHFLSSFTFHKAISFSLTASPSSRSYLFILSGAPTHQRR